MAQGTQEKRATIDDLHRVEGQAELIDGRIVREMPTGDRPSAIALEIVVGLREYARITGRGRARADGIGYTVPELSSGRESFSPDASYYDFPPPANRMRFVNGPPTFAVEVRSENGYGPAAEAAHFAERADYFEAGTRVVWDVDAEARCVRVDRPGTPGTPAVFAAGQVADAEPAVPGWRLAVDDLFA